ncbi:hypothetical protein CCR75_002690 [Bremia lactucae]|uniref:Transmembrane protein n=1 Tax=Bremia lactucae TaxID=4779 RepID=A0A976FQH2_BRELC|nr:hypothetical protein CCR75_002690 [Bremia lactucae]
MSRLCPSPSSAAHQAFLGDFLAYCSPLASDLPREVFVSPLRDSDEGKSEDDADLHGSRHSSLTLLKGHSRIVSELRPVDGPERVFYAGNGEERRGNALQAIDSSEDTWHYIQHVHPLFVVVLVLSGVFATRRCCSEEARNIPRTLVNRRLTVPTSIPVAHKSSFQTGVRELFIPTSRSLQSLFSTTSLDTSQDSSALTSSSLEFDPFLETSIDSSLFESAIVRVTILSPLNDQIYRLSSTITIKWLVSLISGPDPKLDTFRVDFKAENNSFITIAPNESIPSVSSATFDENTTLYTFQWKLANTTAWLCTTCVLQVCALNVTSVPNDTLCLRSDGLSSLFRSSRAPEGTFQIVQDVPSCSCGLHHECFVLAAFMIGVAIPVIVLFVDCFVQIYRERQVFGLLAPRNEPEHLVVAGYPAKSATCMERVVLIGSILGLCIGTGVLAARINSNHFLTEMGAIVELWMVTFAIAVAVGLFFYSTLMCIVIFSIRSRLKWLHERQAIVETNQCSNSSWSDDNNIVGP